jgi:hypothetical protein
MAEDKLARELGFKFVRHSGDAGWLRIMYGDRLENVAALNLGGLVAGSILVLQRKCLELTEQCPCGCGQVRYELAPTPHAHTADNCVCKHCQKTELTDKLEQAMLDAELTERRGLKIDLQLVEDALFIAQTFDANKDRAERMLALGEKVHEMIKQQTAPAELNEQRGGTSQTIPFDCGCFVKFWVEASGLQSGLACCSEHEASHQTLTNLQRSYDISFVYRDGLVEVTKCLNCKTPLMRIYRKGTIAGWDSWIHNEPKKANYQKEHCSERAPGHSTAQIAIPDYGKIRFDCPPDRRHR